MNFPASLKSFYKPRSQIFVRFAQYLDAHTGLTIYKYTSGYNTVSFSILATMILVQ